MTSTANREKDLHCILGAAVVEVWSGLPQEIQEQLFEQAVSAGHGEALRTELAKYLHDHHARTLMAERR